MDGQQRDRPLPPLSASLPGARPLIYCITEGAGATALQRIQAAARAGAHLIQIREKQLSARDLFALCREARRATADTPARLLLNDRMDIALAAGLDGVHLPAHGLPVAAARAWAPPGFLIARSCHSLAELGAAAAADFCVFGPVFDTPSKRPWGPPLGLDLLRQACRSPLPVLALGGVTAANARDCLQAGAAGLAGIRLCQAADHRDALGGAN